MTAITVRTLMAELHRALASGEINRDTPVSLWIEGSASTRAVEAFPQIPGDPPLPEVH